MISAMVIVVMVMLLIMLVIAAATCPVVPFASPRLRPRVPVGFRGGVTMPWPWWARW